MVWRVDKNGSQQERAQELADAVRCGRKTVVIGQDGREKTELLLDVARLIGPQAVLIRVPSGLDQAEAVVLQVAAGLGGEALREVDDALCTSVDRIEPALDVLQRCLGDRLLLVDDIDFLASRSKYDELYDVVTERRGALDAWLGEHARLCSSVAPLDRLDFQPSTVGAPNRPPLSLSNGTTYDVAPVWAAVGQDPARFRLALTLSQLNESPPDPSVGREETLLGAVWAELGPSARELLSLLAIHSRPLSDEVLEALPVGAPSKTTLSRLRSLAAVGSDASALWVDGALLRFCRGILSPEERIHAHLTLAAAFAGELRGDEPNAWSKAASLLEAHRHYAAGRQHDRALQLLRYGVALLLDLARERSMNGDRGIAASIYEEILRLPPAKLNQRGRAYAKHYLHYNRYKAKPDLVEPISETEEGYRASVDMWPQNALFWSRLALTQFLRGEQGRALKTLEEAHAKVPYHPRKEWYLRCRTVQHLLRFDPTHVFDALQAWNRYHPVHGREQEVESELHAALSIGFKTVMLEARGLPAIHLHSAVTVRILRAGDSFACTLDPLFISSRATDPMSALVATIAKLRERTDELRRSLTHTLEPDERAQKQRLLSAVDIVASRLLGEVSDSTWILAKVELAGSTMRVREVGSNHAIFDLGAGVSPPLLPDEAPRLVRLRAGEAGEAVGPVLELGKPLGRDRAGLWAEWRKRLGEAEAGHG